MSILAKKNEIELVVTWMCNWNCEYCSVDTHNQHPLYEEQLKLKLKKIIQGYHVTLSGGEPGYLKRDILQYIFRETERKKCNLSINTNGLFLKRYPEYIFKFSEVIYHCSQDLDLNDEVLIGNYSYLLVVSDNNYYKLDAFLEKYKDIQFNLVAATNPKGMSGPELSLGNKYEMLKKFYHRMTKDSIKRVFSEKEFDNIIYI